MQHFDKYTEALIYFYFFVCHTRLSKSPAKINIYEEE